MKPNLYICHTAYQVLVDLLRAGRCAGKPHTMVLSASVPDTAALAARLDATGVVKTVLVDETRWPGTVTGLFAHRRAARARAWSHLPAWAMRPRWWLPTRWPWCRTFQRWAYPQDSGD